MGVGVSFVFQSTQDVNRPAAASRQARCRVGRARCGELDVAPPGICSSVAAAQGERERELRDGCLWHVAMRTQGCRRG